MARHVAKIFEDVDVQIDGEEFLDCEFRNARMEYAGGPVPVFEGCTFDSNQWRFSGQAGRAMELIRFLHSIPGFGRLV